MLALRTILWFALVALAPSIGTAASDDPHAARLYVKQPGSDGAYVEITGSIEASTDAYIVVVDSAGKRFLYERAAVHHVEFTGDPGTELAETVKKHWSWKREGQLFVVLRQVPGIGAYFQGATAPHIPRDLDVMLAAALIGLVCAFGIYKVYETVVLNRIKVRLEIRELESGLSLAPAAPPLEGMVGFLKHRVLGILAETHTQARENWWRSTWQEYREAAAWLPRAVYTFARVVTLVGALFVLLMAVGLLGVAASDPEKAAIGTRLTALAMAVVSVAGAARLVRTFAILGRSFQPVRDTPATGHAIVFVIGLAAAIGTNISFALTPAVRLDLSVVPALLVLLLAYRFGAVKAAVAGVLVVSPYWIQLVLTQRLEWNTLVYQHFQLGPIYVPHSSLQDLIRLGLLGGLAGWLFNWVRRVPLVDPLPQVARASWPSPAGALAVAPAATAIVISNVVYRLPDRNSMPFAGLAVIVCCGAGVLLGPRRGAVAGMIAALVSIVGQPFLGSAMPRVRFELAEIGHVLSFALMGYWSGHIATRLPSRDAMRSAASRLGLWPQFPDSGTISPLWFIPPLILFSIIWTVKSGPTTNVDLFVPPLAMATVMLMGVACGSRPTAWTAALCLGSATLLGHVAVLGGWTPTLSMDTFALTVRPRLSGPAILVFATAAWLAGTIGLTSSRRNRYWLAIGIFIALELSNLVRYGSFLLPYVSGTVAGARIDLVTGLARLTEPWLTVVLFGLGLRLLRRRARTQVHQTA